MTAQPHKCVVVLAVMEVLSTVCAELHMFSVLLAVVVMLTDDMLKSAVDCCGCTAPIAAACHTSDLSKMLPWYWPCIERCGC